MLGRLLVLFILVPLVELILLLWIADATSWWVTLLLIIATGVLGSALARAQGLRAWMRFRNDMQSGRMPTDSLVDGLMILVAGALLITPGILTDLVGFSLLVPGTRQWYRRRLVAWLRKHARVHVATYTTRGGDGRPRDPDVVDSSAQEVDDQRLADG